MSPAIVAMLLTSGLIGATPTEEGTDGKPVMVLAGIKPLVVFVADLGEAELALGLSIEKLKTDASLRLRSAGVPVSTYDMGVVFGLEILARRTRRKDGSLDGGAVAHVRAWVWERTTFRCDSPASYHGFATVWFRGVLTLGHSASISEEVRQHVRDFADIFALAYLEANPKIPPPYYLEATPKNPPPAEPKK